MKRKGMEINQLSKSVLQKIDSVKITEQDKNRFQQKLDEANKVFSQLLLQHHSTLTNLEVNMCGLFKTGMTDKELARLYGQSDKSYEQHRWRIKKKMKLGREVNLVRYLQGLGV
jgi:DNA-binding CsgD family transcriptional regulator